MSEASRAQIWHDIAVERADHIARLEARVAELEENQKYGVIAEPTVGKMLPVALNHEE